MQTHDLAETYRAKTDGEILQLASDLEQLTPEAHAALTTELANRKLDPARSANLHVEKENGGIQPPTARRWAFGFDSHSISEFIASVLQVYHRQFWFFVKLIAPAVVVGTIAVIMARNEGREIARNLPRGPDLFSHHTEMLEIWLASMAGYFASWMVSCFSFGAICSATRQVEAGIVPSVQECFSEVRKRIGSFLRLSLLLFFLFLVAEAAAVLFLDGFFWVLRQWRIHLGYFVMQFVSFGIAGLAPLVLSRFGLAVPALVLDDCRVVQAMFRSDELTQGKWLMLASLLAKSIVGGYVAAMFPFWVRAWIWPYIQLPGWVSTVASGAGVTVVEPTLFIGFALLYLRVSALSSVLNEGSARQQLAQSSAVPAIGTMGHS